ncbi:MAG: peptidoglycan-binding protein, partial [Acidobacteriota bacterium]|nr:peptidoglycan-binding protein [Acidobacteriota bacterium]
MKATHLALAVVLMLGLGASAFSVPTTASAKEKPAKATSTPSSHSGKSAKGAKKKASSRRERGQKAPTVERVSEIQQALAKDGSYTGSPNGKWDNNTVEAMKKFQGSHGLTASGKLDAKTLQHLGLGSHTAGIAPPMPAVRISSTSGPQAEALQPRQ